MFKLSKNGVITITRGDSFSLDTFINVGTQLEPLQYILENNDFVYFGLMEPGQPFEHALIRKVFDKTSLTDDDLVHMEFDPEMTEYLMPGLYYYMIKLVTADGDVSTIVSKTKFIILD